MDARNLLCLLLYHAECSIGRWKGEPLSRINCTMET
jgi:hypothetical protein